LDSFLPHTVFSYYINKLLISDPDQEEDELINFNFEEQLDILLLDYQQKSEWNHSMDNHVAALSTQLEKYSRDGTMERQVLQKQQDTLEKFIKLQNEIHTMKEQLNASQQKLALSEKSNSVLASRLSMKSEQLKDFLQRIEDDDGSGTGGGTRYVNLNLILFCNFFFC